MNDPWIELRRHTQARIAQGRAGHGLRTETLLDFQLAHAQARDAVHLPWDAEGFALGVANLGLQALPLASQAHERTQYLKRPDLGRKLDEASRERLAGLGADLVLVFSNGLSSTAMETHGLALLKAIADAYAPLRADGIEIAPVCLVPNARVALSDEIGSLLNAKLAVIVVGERPGLSAADSLGIYLTYRPNPINTDARRNCISNIRPPEGLGYQDAAAKLLYLSRRALELGFSGVNLKDEMPTSASLARRTSYLTSEARAWPENGI